MILRGCSFRQARSSIPGAAKEGYFFLAPDFFAVAFFLGAAFAAVFFFAATLNSPPIDG
jgi:hypothetical protein